MNKTLKGSFFVVKGLGVLLVGVPSLVVAASLFCWLVTVVIGPALVFSAVAWSLWKLPGAIKYRRVKGEWKFQVIGRQIALDAARKRIALSETMNRANQTNA